MITRTIRAENMLTALEVIKKEMGSDALVVSARQIMSGPSWQVWRKPLVEVVAVKLVEGEPPELLKAAMAQHQESRPENQEDLSVDALERAAELEQPDRPFKMVEEVPQDTQENIPEYTLEDKSHQTLSDKNRKQSMLAKKYQLKSDPPPLTPEEDQVLGALLEALKPARPREMETQVGNLPPQESHREEPRKKAISAPVFEHLSSGAVTNKKDEIEIEDARTGKKNSVPPIGGQALVVRNDVITTPDSFPSMVSKTSQYLIKHGLDEALVQHAAAICVDMLDAQAVQQKQSVWACMQRQLQAGIKVEEETLNNMSRVIFLVGASGTGKTSTLAKLAVHLSSDHGRKVGWVCADTVRIGSLAEARTYTETIGIPLRVAYTPEELQQSIDGFLDEVEFILVDTPAYNPRSEQSITELGEILTAHARRCTWVVVSATAKENDLQNTLAAIGPFKPRGLVVTKLDETNNYSAVYNIAWRSQLPLTYFSCGSKIVNDLMPARADLLVKAVFDERFIP